jgi:hypothetical protein
MTLYKIKIKSAYHVIGQKEESTKVREAWVYHATTEPYLILCFNVNKAGLFTADEKKELINNILPQLFKDTEVVTIKWRPKK